MIKVRTWFPLSQTHKIFNTTDQAAQYIDSIVEEYEDFTNRKSQEYNEKLEKKLEDSPRNPHLFPRREIFIEFHEIMEMITIIPQIKKKKELPKVPSIP